jgi:hypothetical protein
VTPLLHQADVPVPLFLVEWLAGESDDTEGIMKGCIKGKIKS